MILAVDSSTLVLLINPASNPPDDPATGAPVVQAAERVQHFIGSLRASDTLIIATPVLAEMMVKAASGGPGVLEAVSGLSRVRVAAFGERAAVELAAMTSEALASGHKKGGSTKPWHAVKFDRQIIAIARVERATCLYTDDGEMAAFARALGMEVISTWDLPLPEQDLFSSLGISEGGPNAYTPRKKSLPVSSGMEIGTAGRMLAPTALTVRRALKLDDDDPAE